jgi:hypothetical protein
MLNPAAAPAPTQTAIVMCAIAQHYPHVVLKLKKADPATVEPASAQAAANADHERRSLRERLLFLINKQFKNNIQ